MTVICYRAGVMASDSCWSSYGTQNASAIKIVRLTSGALLGEAGDNDSRAMREILDKIRDPKKLPSRAELAATKLNYEAIIAFPKGGVYMISTGRHDATGYPLGEDGAGESEADYGIWQATTMGGYAACGSGSDIALGAMDAGATAREAVVIACRRNVWCALPVHTIKLNQPKKKSK